MRHSVRKWWYSLLAVVMAVAMLACTGAVSIWAAVLPKTRVGISWTNSSSNTSYLLFSNAIRKAGGEPIQLPEVKTPAEAQKALAEVDALTMPGGADINPAMYGETPEPKLETVDDRRDLSDSTLMREAIRENKPTLVVCRSFQMLNVVQGGTLYQDLPSQFGSQINHRLPVTKMISHHFITVEPDNLLATAIGGPGRYFVNSAHHQGVKKVGKDLQVVARSDDGLPEGLVLKTCKFFLGTQFHPEMMIAAGRLKYVKFFRDLIAAA